MALAPPRTRRPRRANARSRHLARRGRHGDASVDWCSLRHETQYTRLFRSCDPSPSRCPWCWCCWLRPMPGGPWAGSGLRPRAGSGPRVMGNGRRRMPPPWQCSAVACWRGVVAPRPWVMLSWPASCRGSWSVSLRYRRRLLRPRHGWLQPAVAGRFPANLFARATSTSIPRSAWAWALASRAADAGDALMEVNDAVPCVSASAVRSVRARRRWSRRLCKRMRDEFDIAVITNDIYTREDAEFLTRAGALRAGSHRRRRDRRLSPHGDSRGRLDQPRGGGGDRAQVARARDHLRRIGRRQSCGHLLARAGRPHDLRDRRGGRARRSRARAAPASRAPTCW